VRREQLEYHVWQPEDDERAGQQQRRDERLVVGLGRVLVTLVGQSATGRGRRPQGPGDRRAQLNGATTALQHLQHAATPHTAR